MKLPEQNIEVVKVNIDQRLEMKNVDLSQNNSRQKLIVVLTAQISSFNQVHLECFSTFFTPGKVHFVIYFVSVWGVILQYPSWVFCSLVSFFPHRSGNLQGKLKPFLETS